MVELEKRAHSRKQKATSRKTKIIKYKQALSDLQETVREYKESLTELSANQDFLKTIMLELRSIREVLIYYFTTLEFYKL